MDGIAILQKLSADGNDSLPGLDSLDRNGIVMDLSQLNPAHACSQSARTLLRNDHRKLLGLRGERHDRTERNRD